MSHFEEEKEGSAKWRQFYAASFDELACFCVSYFDLGVGETYGPELDNHRSAFLCRPFFCE